MRKNSLTRALLASAMVTAGGGAGALTWAQTQSQPGTPSKAPRQNDPGKTNPSQPGKTNPSQPGQTDPNQPGQTNPNQPGQTDPNQPGRTPPVDPRRIDPDRLNDDDPVDATNRGGQADEFNRYPRPFAFESAESEARFGDSSRRLLLLERRMEENNKDLMRRLSEVRQLRGEAQTQGVLDLMQQILREQQDLHRYLVQARTGWTGEMELEAEGIRREPGFSDGSEARPTTDATPREQNPR